jgi:DNA-binding IclR family transcriptional regulator
MGKTPQADRYIVPGLQRGLELLQLFSAAAPSHSQAEMAAALGVTRSAIFRIVYTLTQQGFLLHDPASGRYALGPGVLRLGEGLQGSRSLLEVARPVLEALRNSTGWSAHLAVREGREVLYLLRAARRRGQASIVRVGTRLPAEVTAMGRVLLAGLSEAALQELYGGVALRRTAPGAPSSLPALLKRAKADQARGLVVHLGTFEAGIASIAAPIRAGDGQVVAAINLSAALEEAENPSRREAVAAKLLQATVQIAQRLGQLPR